MLRNQSGSAAILIILVVVGVVAVAFLFKPVSAYIQIVRERNDPSCAWDSNTTLMYGEKPRCPYLKRADDLFIKQVLKAHGGDKQLAVLDISSAGWVYFYSGDYDTAMKRFNQEWLLDQAKSNTYWSFALLLYKQNKINDANRMIDRTFSLVKNEEDYKAYHCDLIFQSESTNDKTRISRNDDFYNKIKKYLDNSLQKFDSNSCHFNSAANYYLMDDNNKMQKEVDLAKKNGEDVPHLITGFLAGTTELLPEMNAALQEVHKDSK